MTTTLSAPVTNYLLHADWGERSASVVSSFVLIEVADGGGYLLQEYGDKFILEEIIPTHVLLEDGTSFFLDEDGNFVVAYDTAPSSYMPLLLHTEVTNYLLNG